MRTKKQVTITLSPKIHKKGKEKAKEKGLSFSTLVEQLIRNYNGELK